MASELLSVVIGLSIVIGAVQCFFGYLIFKIILGLTGFLVGGVLAGAIGYAVSQQEIVALLAGLVGGAIGAALMVALFLIGVFLIGAFFGGVLGAALYAVAGNSPEPAVLLILAVIAGVLAVIFQKFMIILSTAFGGAWNVVTGIAFFTTGAIDPTDPMRFFQSGGTLLYTVVLCWIALGIAGMVVQYRMTRGIGNSLKEEP